MIEPKTIQNLKLRLNRMNTDLPILAFDNYSGVFEGREIEKGEYQAEISNEIHGLLWSGIVQVAENGVFDLCVAPNGSDVSEILRWRDLPHFFSVFDGGYTSISEEKISELLDDLVTFRTLVKIRCHFELNGEQQSINGIWGDQESLKSLSEIFVGIESSIKLQPQQLVLLEIELFETVFFVVSVHEEGFEDGLILSLSAHFYQQKNRIGRRIPIHPIKIGEFSILEVSDFGMRVSAPLSIAQNDKEITLKLSDHPLRFGVVYRTLHSDSDQCLGLQLLDHSQDARKTWQAFLLAHQYPNLTYRTPEKHEDLFRLYEATGYTDQEMALIIAKAKDQIISEWKNVDSIGPALGAMVIGYEGGKPVATIGVSNAAGSVWMAQAAAVFNQPEFMGFTRAMYSWRTRYILQQIDGKVHLAFFLKNKPFLNRFFRKFYLKKQSQATNSILWEEWFHYAAVRTEETGKNLIMKEEHPPEAPINPTSYRDSKVFGILSENGCLVEACEDSVLVRGRQFAHIDQYLNSVLINAQTNLLSSIDKFKSDAVFIILSENPLTEQQIVDLTQSGFDVSGGYEEVSWACPRAILPEFLENSLKSLEIMVRKYRKAA